VPDWLGLAAAAVVGTVVLGVVVLGVVVGAVVEAGTVDGDVVAGVAVTLSPGDPTPSVRPGVAELNELWLPAWHALNATVATTNEAASHRTRDRARALRPPRLAWSSTPAIVTFLGAALARAGAPPHHDARFRPFARHSRYMRVQVSALV
jgi:hypothetical protein